MRATWPAGWTPGSAAGREPSTLPQVTVAGNSHERLAGAQGSAVLDVRSDEEWADGHIAGAAHTFAGAIAQGADAPVDARRTQVAVICGSGYRSSVAASLLQARGYPNLINVSGGMGAWQEAGCRRRRMACRLID